MRASIVAVLLFLLALPVSGSEHTVRKDTWLFIPASLPKAKVGGGEFYTLHGELIGNDDETDLVVVNEGVRFRSATTGTFHLLLIVNHIVKSSCAGVEIKQHRTNQLRVTVVN